VAGKKYDKTHDHIVDLLHTLVREYPDYQKTQQQSKTYPLIIQSKKDTKEHHPDIWAKVKKTNQIDIYEVWNTEEERQACSDILHAACVDNIRYIHIVCVNNPKFADQAWKKEDAKKLVRIFLDHIRDDSGKLLLEPSMVCYADLGANELEEDNKILKSLKQQLEF